MKHSMYVGMDVHKATIAVSVAIGGSRGEVRNEGTIANTGVAIDRLFKRLSKEKRPIVVAYEAGPTGFPLYRRLRDRGVECLVVSPSLIPRRSGDRVKTDRRDSETLARLLRAGELEPIHVPSEEDEAIRDLVRARNDAVIDRRRARQRVQSFVLRHNLIYSGKTTWGPMHWRWLGKQSFSQPAQQIAFQESLQAVDDTEARVKRIEEQLFDLAKRWRMVPLVNAYQALRGVSQLSAITLAAELGDIRRFAKPSELMGFLGLVPSEHSSGQRQRRGAITKTGNIHARRTMVESAWSYRDKPMVSRALKIRQEELPKEIVDISWRAQSRLCKRRRVMNERGRAPQVVTTALARELSSFVWEIANAVKIESPS